MKLIFMGTPDFAVYGLEALHKSAHTILAVVTVPDKPQGRGKKILPSPVKEKAIELGYNVLQPESLNSDEFYHQVEELDPECIVVIAFKKIPERIFDLPAFGAINIHGSLLPKYRGAAPINHAIMNGETETGVTSFYINEEIDAGTILLQKSCAIGPQENFGDIYYKLAHLGADLIVETLDQLDGDGIVFKVQDQTIVSKAPKISPETCLIEWEKPAENIHNMIRGLAQRPCAYSYLNGKKVKFYSSEYEHDSSETKANPGEVVYVSKKEIKIATGDGFLVPTSVQIQGKKQMNIVDFLNGNTIEVGSLLTNRSE